MGDKNKGLDKHGNCNSHLTAVKVWESYLSNPVSIEERLTPGRPAVVDQNREYFAKIVKYIRWFCLQEIALRGVEEHEQLSLCLRYSIGSRPIEKFVQLVHLSDGSYGAQAIVKEVEKLVTELIHVEGVLTGLGADGASVMSGQWAGMQALLKQIYPWLIYVHCVAHRLNLVIVASLKGTCKNILTIVDKLHSLFSSAKTNDVFMKVQQETSVKVMAMPERSETRWSSMFYVLDVICARYKEILMTLVKRAADNDDLAITAGGLYHKLASGQMILTCVALKKALAITTNLSDLLQSSQLEWSSAAQEIQACKTLLTFLQQDESISSIINQAKTISEKCATPLTITSPIYSIRSHFSDTELDVSKFTKEFVVKVCSKVLSQMLLRFPPKGLDILKGIDALNAASTLFLNEQLLSKLLDHYGADTLNVNKTLLELEVKKYKLQFNPNTPSATNIDPKFYPNLMKLFHLKRSLPVSSAEAERSFSTMKRVKTPLRNRMTDEKLSELCLLSSERDITKKLDINNVIDIFNVKPRHIPL